MPQLTRDAVSGEALFILKNLKENTRLGRSNKLADVKGALEPSVSLDFDTYFFFLRKFHYLTMDREARLELTGEGERVVGGEQVDRFTGEVGEFFAEQLLSQDEATHGGFRVDAVDPVDEPLFPPSPPPTDIDLDDHETLVPKAAPPQPPPRRRSVGQAPTQDEPFFPPPPPPAPSFGQLPPSPLSAHRPAMPPAPAAVAAAEPAAPRGTEIDLRYVKFDPIGSGPLGTVFKGRHNALGLDISVKELKDIFGYFSFLQRGEVIKRLKRELCAQAQVRHPNVVSILDQNTDVARPYFVMELCRGSLRERLDQAGGKPLPVNTATRWFLQLCYALRAAHGSGLTHHNVKPENVLFDAYGNVKVGDFGLGRVIEVDAAKGMPQVIVGTGGMAYMSPELIGRHKDAGPAADVYAVGILFYELLTGGLPGRRSPLPSEVNSEVPSKLDPIFDKMTQDRREARYPDFDAVLDDFYGAFSDGELLGRGDLVLRSDRDKDA